MTRSAPGFETLSTQAKFVGIDSALNLDLTPADPDAVIPDGQRESSRQARPR